MTVRIVCLGTRRIPDEGIRIGTVRRPPRGVPKSEYSAQNWYDVWFPNLSPSLELITGMNPKASFGNPFRSKLRAIIPSAERDCSTYQFPCTSLWKLEFHE
jgi:uncharacterized protein YeaO (DUF488 family)